MRRIGILWRTVRHLKMRQIIGRVVFRVVRPVPDLRPPPPRTSVAGPWATPARRDRSLVGPERFRFLNEEHSLSAIGWDDPAIEKLWRYNQHYFDDLNAWAAVQRSPEHRQLISRWIMENPPGRGTGWEPYPTSLRITNWLKWALSGSELDPRWLHSLAIQARWLSKRLEWHLLGNHLFANAKALFMAGLFFDGPEAERWRNIGQAILGPQLAEQILPDGGQFERSPMYHALALEDVLDLINVIECLGPRRPQGQALGRDLRSAAPAMLQWLRTMSYPDGTLAHFNDSAEGIAPSLSELERYAASLDIDIAPPLRQPVIHLRDSGYIRLNHGPASAWIDAAPIGPDYLPGHAHADTLSFELVVKERPILVNGGTSCYGTGARRQRERSTVSHNTVVVGSWNSSEVWAGFRVGRRARPIHVETASGRVAASHDGYRFLPGSPIHRRAWRMDHELLEVEDIIEPTRSDACAFFRLAPALAPIQVATRVWDIRHGAATLARVEIVHGVPDWIQSDHAARFGAVEPTLTLRCAMPTGRCTTRWTWIS